MLSLPHEGEPMHHTEAPLPWRRVTEAYQRQKVAAVALPPLRPVPLAKPGGWRTLDAFGRVMAAVIVGSVVVVSVGYGLAWVYREAPGALVALAFVLAAGMAARGWK